MKSADLLNLSTEQRDQLRIRERLKGLAPRDIVKRWYQSEVAFDLTEQEDVLRRRWDWVKAQFLDRKTYAEIREAMATEFGVSGATASRDIRDALDCFGELDRVPVEAHRQRAIVMALEAFKTAKEEKDAKAMAAATKAYMEAAGVDKDDSARIDIERLMKERIYVEALDTQVRSLLLNLIARGGGALDMSQVFAAMYEANAEDLTDYEQIPDDAPADPQ